MSISARLIVGGCLIALYAGPVLAQQAPAPGTSTPPTPPLPGTPAALTPAAQPAPVPVAQVVPVAPASTNFGKIQFGEPIFDFGRIKSGDVVKHSFIFTNVGTGTLELANVQPGCGCTHAGEWTKRVEPGQTGLVPIQFNSANFDGMVMKSVTVTCNDKAQPVVILQIKGTIWKPIAVTPQFAVLNIPPDADSASVQVTITNNMEEMIEIFSPFSNNRAITAEIVTNTPGRGYQVRVKASQPLPPGNTQGQINLKTSSTNIPVVTVQVWANVQAAVMVMPPQITLPAAPLQTRTLPTVMIQNYSTNTLQVSEPSLDLQDVEVKVNEVQPGRSYSVSINFPQGYELPAGKPVALTVKTSHPQYPLLKIPIQQLPRAAAAAVPAAAITPGLAPPFPVQTAGHK